MKKFFYLIMFLVGSLAFGQEDSIPSNIYGVWKSEEGEFLNIRYGEIFQRRSADGEVLAAGEIIFRNGEMHIVRYDKEDEYDLAFFVNHTTMVISKPRTNKAWLWYKIQ